MIKCNVEIIFFGKKCSKFCISFIEQNIEVEEEEEQKVEKDDVSNEGIMETDGTNRQYKRVCRHMGLSESSPSCGICNLVRLFSCQ